MLRLIRKSKAEIKKSLGHDISSQYPLAHDIKEDKITNPAYKASTDEDTPSITMTTAYDVTDI